MEVAILATAVGSTPYLLTGTRPEEQVADAVLDHARSQQAIETVRGAGVQGRDYGNTRHTLTFSIFREWANEGAASRYHLLHPSSVPATGSVRFIHRTSAGIYVGTTTLLDATIVVTRCTWEGCSTTTTYQITGGQMVAG